MKHRWISILASVVLVVGLAILAAPKAAAQNVGDYRSKQSGNWGDPSTWERYDGTTWVNATAAPTYTDGVITIRNGHTVTVATDVTVDQVVVETGGQVMVNSEVTLFVANGSDPDLSISGTYLNQGTISISSGATWEVLDGGTFIHNARTAISSPLDSATLNATSNFIYRGSSALNPYVSVSNRTYGNLAFESTSGLWTPTVTGTNPLTVNGDFSLGIAGAGTVSFNASGNFTGAMNINGALAIGTGNTLTSGSSSTISVKGNWTNNGTFTAGTGTVTFNGSGTQNLTANVATAFNNLTVNSGATLVETVSSDNATVSGTLTNNGTIRKSQSVSGTGSKSFGLTGVTLNVTTQGSLSNLQVDRIDSNHSHATSYQQTGKYWALTATGNSFTVDVTLSHNSLADPSACRYTGDTNWNCARTSFTSSTVTRSGVTVLSDWAVGNGAPTAITLSSLTARPFAPQATLFRWQWLALAVGLVFGGGAVARRLLGR